MTGGAPRGRVGRDRMGQGWGRARAKRGLGNIREPVRFVLKIAAIYLSEASNRAFGVG